MPPVRDRSAVVGDPLVLRVETVDAKDAPAVRDSFIKWCVNNEYVPGALVEGVGTACERDGVIIEGFVHDGVVSASVVSAEESHAERLTPVFQNILAALK